MDFGDVVRRRRMTRTYTDDAVPRALLDRVIDAGLSAPSAGFSQGVEVIVLEDAQTELFWSATARPGRPPTPGGRWARLRTAPVVVLPLAHKAAYLKRYGEVDKADLGMDRESGWPMPYWDIDAAFAVMAMLLAATDAGLGALFFAIRHGEDALLTRLGVPVGYRPIGAMTLGWAAPDDRPSPSLARGRRPRSDVVHYGGWAT